MDYRLALAAAFRDLAKRFVDFIQSKWLLIYPDRQLPGICQRGGLAQDSPVVFAPLPVSNGVRVNTPE